MEVERIRCCTCGMIWPCNTPGGNHMSTGELEAKVDPWNKLVQISDELRYSKSKGRR